MIEETNQKSVKILGVKVDITSVTRVIRQVVVDIEKGKKFFVVTPNPEQIVLAQQDEEFINVLNSADINVPDGVGVVAAYKFLTLPETKNLLTRPIMYLAQGMGVAFSILFDKKWITAEMSLIRGRDLFLKLIELANKKGWRVYLLGGWEKVAQRSKINLEQNYKKVVLKGGTGPILENDATPVNKEEKKVEGKIIQEINKFNPHILFVGFRAPVQEKWVYKHLKRLNIGGAMVVGGTFNYMSGRAKMPSVWMADLGLEWLWRLLTGSQTKKRILNAFPKFALKIFAHKLFKSNVGQGTQSDY